MQVLTLLSYTKSKHKLVQVLQFLFLNESVKLDKDYKTSLCQRMILSPIR